MVADDPAENDADCRGDRGAPAEDGRDFFCGSASPHQQGRIRRSGIKGSQQVRRNPEGDRIGDEADASECHRQHGGDGRSPYQPVRRRIAGTQRLGPAEHRVDAGPPGQPLRPVAGERGQRDCSENAAAKHREVAGQGARNASGGQECQRREDRGKLAPELGPGVGPDDIGRMAVDRAAKRLAKVPDPSGEQ